jgi:hypothetical protein
MGLVRMVALVVAGACVCLGLYSGFRPATTDVMVLCMSPVGPCPTQTIDCGSAFIPAAFGSSGLAQSNEAECGETLHDARVTSITLLGVGAMFIVGLVLMTASSRRRRSDDRSLVATH